MRAATTLLFAALGTLLVPAAFAQHEHMQHEHSQAEHSQADHATHAAEVDRRGDERMGFRHDLTKHTFVLTKDGGRIEVRANSAEDAQSVAQIRSHLQEVARQFTANDFSSPMFIHDQVPPGVNGMRSAQAKLSYTYQDLPMGGVVVIRSKDKAATAAVHEFLRFQIADHRTGDTVAVR